MFVTMIWAFASTASAQDKQVLVVWLKGGQKITHDLTDKPETRFSNGQLMLSTAKISVSYPLSDVLRYTYEGPSTSISSPKLRSGEIRVQQNAEEMLIEGLAPGIPIETYSLDGKLLQTQHSVSREPSLITFKGQPQGVYLIKIGDTTYKFLKR